MKIFANVKLTFSQKKLSRVGLYSKNVARVGRTSFRYMGLPLGIALRGTSQKLIAHNPSLRLPPKRVRSWFGRVVLHASAKSAQAAGSCVLVLVG